MKENELRKIVSMVCNDYVDTIMDAIEENNTKDFPILMAVWQFMCGLRDKGILLDVVDVFDDANIIDRLHREISRYLAG